MADKTKILRKSGWLSAYDSRLQDAVFAQGHVQHVSAGMTIVEVGGPPGGCFAGLSGRIALTIAPGESGPHVAHISQPGHWFGEATFFGSPTRKIGAQAVSDCDIFHLPLSAMHRLSAQDPAWIHRFGQCMMLNLDLALDAIDGLLIPDTPRRIAATLLRCLGDAPRGAVPVSQADLGRLSNASRKVVNRTLAAFEAQGWLARKYGEIIIDDKSGLRRFVQTE